MAYKIDSQKCIACGGCSNICPMTAISQQTDGKYQINPTLCASCGVCAGACPVGAITAA